MGEEHSQFLVVPGAADEEVAEAKWRRRLRKGAQTFGFGSPPKQRCQVTQLPGQVAIQLASKYRIAALGSGDEFSP